MKHKKLTMMVCTLALLAAGCETGAGRGAPLPLMTFSHISPLPVNVGALNVVNEASPSEVPFVVAPQSAVETYLHRRFSALGLEGSLRAVIEEAQVSEARKPSESKVAQFFDVAGTEEYSIRIRLRLEHISARGTVLYSNVLKAERILRMSEHDSIATREKHQLEGLETLFQDIDRETQRIVLRDMKLGV